jgi:hypothetical protein
MTPTMIGPHEDFISAYINYCQPSEAPDIFHRWAIITTLGAWLGRNFYFQHGHFTLKPNVYCMLMGVSGTRKSTPIKIVRKFMDKVGYTTFAAERTSKEQFLLDLSGAESMSSSSDEDESGWNLNLNLGGDSETFEAKADMLIAADEFNDFIGAGNMEFISLLGTFWDFEGAYKARYKRAASTIINDPVVSILAGNTPTGFANAFPVEAIGQGFFSRLLLIHAEPTGEKITFPAEPPAEKTRELMAWMHKIKGTCIGRAELTDDASKLLDRIYKHYRPIGDVRFESYCSRRFSHLLKLCLVTAASLSSRTITKQAVIYANTILHAAEHFMPLALGEFGKSKNSDVVQKIMQIVASNDSITRYEDLFKQLHAEVDSQEQLAGLIKNLLAAGKIQQVTGGLLPVKKSMAHSLQYVDFSMLTEPEQKSLGLLG